MDTIKATLSLTTFLLFGLALGWAALKYSLQQLVERALPVALLQVRVAPDSRVR